MSDSLILPAIRARLGDQDYYMTSMKLKDVAERILLAQDFHETKTLNDFIQRQLEVTRATNFAYYLQHQKQRFFNSLVIGIYGGTPEWLSVILASAANANVDLPISLDEQLGVLSLSGDETLFAIDGQHRVAGMKEAFENKKSLGREDVPLIIIGHDTSAKGMARTRRLFTTLNKHAKAVSKYDTIALDQDDIPAIVTRRLVEEYDLFKHHISSARSKNLPVSDAVSITSLVALYDCVSPFLKNKIKSKDKTGWLDDASVDPYYKLTIEFWNTMRQVFPELNQAIQPHVTLSLRGTTGGSVLFRPAGLNAVVNAIMKLESTGVPWKRAVQRVAKVPMELAGAPWLGLLWNASKPGMITTTQNQKLAERIVFYGAGGDLSAYKTTKQQLQSDLAALVTQDAGAPKIMIYIK